MITNPFARRRKTPLDQALDVADQVRAEAADAARMIGEAAGKVAEALGDAPAPEKRKLPAIGIAAAAGLGVALAARSRIAARKAEPPLPPSATGAIPRSPAVTTAAETSAPASKTPASTPAEQVEPEQPSEARAATSESEAATG